MFLYLFPCAGPDVFGNSLPIPKTLERDTLKKQEFPKTKGETIIVARPDATHSSAPQSSAKIGYECSSWIQK